MILVNKYESDISIDEAFVQCVDRHDELVKIFEFIDLPQDIREIEGQNSAILRNYYTNALDDNLIDIKSVKYLLNKNIRPSDLSEQSILQYDKAYEYLQGKVTEELSIEIVYVLQRILVTDLYNNGVEINLFSDKTVKNEIRLDEEKEYELESLFDYLNNDTEFHPIIQSWMLHFRILSANLFGESSIKIASLLQYYWLKKHKMDLGGLMSIEHELYINKDVYRMFLPENRKDSAAPQFNEQMSFGLQMHNSQLSRIKHLLNSYYRRQIEFDKLNPRQKNIMNYVFERGYKLKEVEESVLNKRQKLIMYIIQNRGFISTKELVSEFDCNRKTIQRDFTNLLQMGFVKSIGAGAGLRYCVNLSERQNHKLAKYQADFIRKSEVLIPDEIAYN